MQKIQKQNRIRKFSITLAALLVLSLTDVNTIKAENSQKESAKESIEEVLDNETTTTSENIQDENKSDNTSQSEESQDDIVEEQTKTKDKEELLTHEKSIEETENEQTQEIEADEEAEGTYLPTEVRQATMSALTTNVNIPFTTSFIQNIAPLAMELGEEFGLYPSVIIAQAALESGWGGKSPALPDDYILSLPPNYNLFGVKGDYNGKSVAVFTKEFDKKANKFIEIVDYFRKYPSYKESLLDYVSKMRYNLTTTDPYVYSGVWRENAKSYQDATASLTGLYATDPNYHTKLNKIIKDYNLTQYDELVYPEENKENKENIEELAEAEVAIKTSITAYRASLHANTSIYPEINSTKVIGNSNKLPHASVIVRQVGIVNNEEWILIEQNGKTLGWVLKSKINPLYASILRNPVVAYQAKVSDASQNIYSRPAWTEGNLLIANSKDYSGQTLTITEEMVTDRGTYSKIALNGKQIGWINKAGLTGLYDEIISSSVVAYRAEISATSENFYSNPFGTENNYLTTNSIHYVGQLLTVKEEQVTTRGTYANVYLGSRELGWINKSNIKGLYDSVLRNPIVAYRAEISDSTQNLYSRPAWTANNKLVANSKEFVGKLLTVKEEMITTGGTYSKLFLGNQELGWINKAGLKGLYDKVLRNPIVAYRAEIGDITQNFYSRPAWTENNYLTTNSRHYKGELLTVKEEMVTSGGTYSKVFLNSKELGWINKAGLLGLYDKVLERKTVSYNALIEDTSQNFYSNPAWTEGNYLTTNASSHIRKKLSITEEIRTAGGVYAKAVLNGKVLGWINKLGLRDNIVIYLDPGHGGIPATGGNPGPVYNGVREQDLNLTISLQVRNRLEQLGYQVVMSRENDLNSYHNKWEPDLYARPAHANAIGADLLVSVHHNAHPSSKATNGIETYIYGPNPSYAPLPENKDSHNNPQRISESQKVANAIHKDLIKNTGATDRGIKEGAFIVVREAKMPAVLLELGFMSNSAELSKLRTNSYQQKLINGIVSGIHNYFLI